MYMTMAEDSQQIRVVYEYTDLGRIGVENAQGP